ncbi:MAG: hypothetical protein JWN04_2175 [Myxococcaceae bacterium]|nr:hypothetical protein [Myxococcaceae bacterium]
MSAVGRCTSSWRASIWTLLVCCAAPVEPRTQVVVTVSADTQIEPQLKAIKVQLYPAYALDEHAPSRVQRFLLSSAEGDKTYTLPFSFGISREHADLFLLMVSGCADPADCSDVVVEQKTLVRFQHGKTAQLDVLLTAPCERASLRCAGLQTTCVPDSSGPSPAGTCTSVREAAVTIIQPGDQRNPDLRPSSPDSFVDAQVDAGPLGPEDAAYDASVSDAATRSACPADNSCTAEYPCVPDDGGGYACRGELADWPMPDSLPGSKFGAKYEVMPPGVVHDDVTQLDWQQLIPDSYAGCTGAKLGAGDSCTWEEAQRYCASLQLADRTWRLPSKIELESLIDMRAGTNGPDPSVFFVSRYDAHWTGSTSPVPGNADQAYDLQFLTGMTALMKKTVPAAVRCVHSEDAPPAPGPRFEDRSFEPVVGDRRTQLIWSSQPYVLCSPTYSYADAMTLCAGLPDGLRVPSMKELLTLVDPLHAGPSIVEPFAATSSHSWFWSSTRSPHGTEQMLVGFDLGTTLTAGLIPLTANGPDDKPTYCVRCVK